MSHPCVFFDRDGIVNRFPGHGRYVERLEEFHLLPEFVEALRVVNEKGYRAVIVTNQRGIALGRMSLETVERIHDHLEDLLAKEGLDLLDIRMCPAEHDSHPRRKPNPGMLLEAAEQHDLDLSRSWMVGDSEKDVIAGKRAGCRTVLVGGGDAPSAADHRLAVLSELPAFLRNHLGGPGREN
jgi:D-glycero-D-manno-heptose 1,7-bisphosphate phosphatase